MSYFHSRSPARLAVASVLAEFVSFAASAQHEDEVVGVSDTFDAVELIPSAATALPPILSGQEAGARERGAAVAVPPPADSAREWFGVSDWWTWQRATGGWGGGRTTLEDAGVVFAGFPHEPMVRCFSSRKLAWSSKSLDHSTMCARGGLRLRRRRRATTVAARCPCSRNTVEQMIA